MTEDTIIPVKYIFIDVVGFTFNRSVDTQAEIVGSLNEIVKLSVNKIAIPSENIIFIPTGDGICICLLNIIYLKEIGTAYDAHLRIALNILEEINKYNDTAKDEQHKFQVRVGINENIDNVVVDINGNRNVAGDGINMSQRIMSLADGNQILVSETVFSTVSVRERYFNSAFRKLPNTKIKHGNELSAYQFVASGYAGLNTELPERYRTQEKSQLKLTKLAAYYLAHAIKNKIFLMEMNTSYRAKFTGTVFLYFLADDSVEISKSSSIDTVKPKSIRFGNDLKEQYDYFENIDSRVVMELGRRLQEKYLFDYYDYFEKDRSGQNNLVFVNSLGKAKLKEEWEEIWDKFSLDEFEHDQNL
jgi:class 3 adenylate cyclase